MASHLKAALVAAGIGTAQLLTSAQAITLHGYANAALQPTNMYQTSYSTYAYPTAPQTQATPRANRLNANAQAGTQRSDYEGIWHCVSRVTSSSVPTIGPGREMECLLRFQQDANGRLLVYWDQAGWNSAQCAVVQFSPAQSTIVHKSMNLQDPGWAALSHDKLQMQDASTMEGHSRVVQYQFGRNIGTYETVSLLTRVR